jgi:dynactin-5
MQSCDRLGRCIRGERRLARSNPAYLSRQFTYYPQRISDFVTIGRDAVVEAAQIGSGVEIGEGAIIVCSLLYHKRWLRIQGQFVIIKDLAVIKPGTVLADATVVSSMSIWEGNPGQSMTCRASLLSLTLQVD